MSLVQRRKLTELTVLQSNPQGIFGLTHFSAHYFISGCAESVYSYTICHTHPFIQWLSYPTPVKVFFSVPEKEVELRVGISSEYYYGRYKRRAFFSEKNTGGRVLPSFYNGLYGKTPPERGIFFRLQVYERERISLVEVNERVGKSVYIFRSVKWPKQMLTYAFYGCEKFQDTFLPRLFKRWIALSTG